MSGDSKKDREVPREGAGPPERGDAQAREPIDLVDPPFGPMDPFRWIEHRNTELLRMEFRRGTRTEEAQRLERFIDVLSSKLPGSILLLVDLTEASFWSQVALEWQKSQDLVDAKCRRIAVIGARGVIRTACRIFLDVAEASGNQIGWKVKFLANVEAAKDWLVDGRPPK